MNRFEMANQLVTWARERHKEMMNLHRDVLAHYAAANGLIGSYPADASVVVRLQIAIKTILEQSRSALDYCARDLHELAVGKQPNAKIYFPIVQLGKGATEFRSTLDRVLPGLRIARPDIAATLETYQAYISQENEWLPCFHNLCNENKHENLSIHRQVLVPVECREEFRGKPVFALHAGPRNVLGQGFAMLTADIRSANGEDPGFDKIGVFLVFSEIDFEVGRMMHLVVEGVAAIIGDIVIKHQARST